MLNSSCEHEGSIGFQDFSADKALLPSVLKALGRSRVTPPTPLPSVLKSQQKKIGITPRHTNTRLAQSLVGHYHSMWGRLADTQIEELLVFDVCLPSDAGDRNVVKSFHHNSS